MELQVAEIGRLDSGPAWRQMGLHGHEGGIPHYARI
jgi:hypothetical protein